METGKVRLRRTGLLAQTLVDRGHDVLWWTADFFHASKAYRCNKDETVEVQQRYRVRFLHGPGYQKNVSVARLRDHRAIARKFLRQAKAEPKPDIVMCSCPTLDLSLAATRYGHKSGVPVVLDVRFLWPDVFLEAVPQWGRPLAQCCFWPYYRMARRACSDAAAIVGNTEAFVEWGVRHASRSRTHRDRPFPFGYAPPKASDAEMDAATEYWRSAGVETEKGLPIACFFGTVGYQFDFDTIIAAARRVLETHDMLFVLCGEGDLWEHYREKSADCERILFPGWVNGLEVWRLMQMSNMALAPYIDSPNFRFNLTNKPIEYLAGGLPILSSLEEGVVANLLQEHHCGLTYGKDSERLAQAIRRLLDSPGERQQMARNARRLFEERYVAEKVYGDMALHLEAIARDWRTSAGQSDFS